MQTAGWTIRFEGYLPVDDRLEDRLRRVVAEIDRLPDAALHLDRSAQTITIDCSRIPGWQDAARGLVRAVRVGRRLVVKPPWDAFTARPEDVVLEIDAEGVFGSGLHQTTALSLELLERHIAPGAVAVDFGTGSGVLAIAAVLLGASRVVALDAIPEAVAAAEANARWNRLQDRITVLQATSPTCAQVRADLVTANITGGVISTHAAALFDTLRSGGLLITSGFATAQEAAVVMALADAGFQVIERAENGNWVGLLAMAAREE